MHEAWYSAIKKTNSISKYVCTNRLAMDRHICGRNNRMGFRETPHQATLHRHGNLNPQGQTLQRVRMCVCVCACARVCGTLYNRINCQNSDSTGNSQANASTVTSPRTIHYTIISLKNTSPSDITQYISIISCFSTPCWREG